MKDTVKNRATPENPVVVLINEAEQAWMKADFKETYRQAALALELAVSLGDRQNEAQASYLMGLAECYRNNYDTALEKYYQALKIHEELGNRNYLAEDLNSIGHIYVNLKDYDQALGYFQRSLQIRPDYHRTFNNLSVIYLHQQNIPLALEYAEKALDLLSREMNSGKPDRGEKRSYLIALVNIGSMYLKSENYDRALEYFTRAVSEAREQDLQTYLAGLSGLGAVHTQQGRYQEAVEYLLQALELANKHDNKEPLLEIYQLLYEVYERMQNYPQAFRYLRLNQQLDRSIFSEKMSERIARLQSELEIETKELEARRLAEKASRLATIGVIAAGITHEINQPLCAIKVSTDSILFWDKKHSLVLPEDIRESLENISEACDRIDEIVQHMRSFWSMPEAENPQPLDLNSVIKKALSLLERQICSHGIFLDYELSGVTSCIRAVPIHIEQVIINIVVNALHSLDECRQREKYIRIRTRVEPEKVILEVEDNGTGLPADIGEKLYDPFFSTKKPGQGMGLGLAIVKRYLDRCQAEISATNNASGGATFRLAFPAVSPQECL